MNDNNDKVNNVNNVDDKKTDCVPVMGHLARNWTELNDRNPAVVLNPNAGPLDLMAWCWSELVSLNCAVDALQAGTDDINKGDFCALIVHRMDPLLGVFERALDKLIDDDKARRAVKS